MLEQSGFPSKSAAHSQQSRNSGSSDVAHSCGLESTVQSLANSCRRPVQEAQAAHSTPKLPTLCEAPAQTPAGTGHGGPQSWQATAYRVMRAALDRGWMQAGSQGILLCSGWTLDLYELAALRCRSLPWLSARSKSFDRWVHCCAYRHRLIVLAIDCPTCLSTFPSCTSVAPRIAELIRGGCT